MSNSVTEFFKPDNLFLKFEKNPLSDLDLLLLLELLPLFLEPDEFLFDLAPFLPSPTALLPILPLPLLPDDPEIPLGDAPRAE